MRIWTGILDELAADGTAWILLGAMVTALLVPRRDERDQRRIKSIFVLVALHLLLVPIAGTLRAYAHGAHREVRLVCLLFAALAVVTMSSATLFTAILPRLRVTTPRIVQDVVTAGAAIVAGLFVAGHAGLDLSGIIATSAVLTAVIGFSLQDTLGNVIGGLALQTEGSIRVGDWVKIGDLNGRVTEMRWRFTAVETRNWETVFIPNSVLLKNQVMVLGRREGKPQQWRRWVWFNVDYRHAPPTVIEVVDAALSATQLPNVATDPKPHAIIMDYGESWARYAVRYWLTDIAPDDPTDSAVRQCIYFALKRAGIPLAIPGHAVFLTEDTDERRTARAETDMERRMASLAKVDLFDDLPADERRELAASLRHAPFLKGEVMTRQGAAAHWLYVVTSGECSVRVRVNDEEREVARVKANEFFGEMSLLTGAPRSATVVALTNVDCWRLDRGAFQRLLSRRPELAEEVARTLASRQVALDATRENLTQEARENLVEETHKQFTDRIRSFFGLGD